MAKCPGNCKTNWQWDQDMDIYRRTDTGEFCKQQEIYKEKGVEVTLFKCTECNVIFSVQVLDPEWGAAPFNHPDWDGIDWQSDKESFPFPFPLK